MMPMNFASQVTGLPRAKPNATKAPTRRGRKPSGKPGAQHLSLLQQAHGAGDFSAAKTHALNYAKAVHTSMSALPSVETGEPDADDGQMTPPPSPPNVPTVGAPQANSRALLAKLVMSRKK